MYEEHGDDILVNGIEFQGYHGILPEERRNGGRYRVDLRVRTSIEEACRTDKISSTVDYRQLCSIVVERGTGTRCNLIEKLAADIADDILRQTSAIECSVTLYKYPPDIQAQSVAIRVHRRRLVNNPG